MPKHGDKRKLVLNQSQISEIIIDAIAEKGLVPDGKWHSSMEYSLIPVSRTETNQLVELQITIDLTYQEEPN